MVTGGLVVRQKPLQFVSVRKRRTVSYCPNDGDPAKTVDKEIESSSITQKLRFWLWRSSLITTALCSSGGTGPSPWSLGVPCNATASGGAEESVRYPWLGRPTLPQSVWPRRKQPYPQLHKSFSPMWVGTRSWVSNSLRNDPPEKWDKTIAMTIAGFPGILVLRGPGDWHEVLLKQQPIHYRVNQNIALCLPLHLFIEKQERWKSQNMGEMSKLMNSHTTLKLQSSMAKMLISRY